MADFCAPIRRILSPLLLVTLFAVAGCVSMRSPLEPLELRRYGEGHDTLAVLLPGRDDDVDTFLRHGFVERLKREKVPPDIAAVGAYLPYYKEGTIIEKLRQEVILPAKKAGYRHIWLVGISMGGTGALLYEREHPGEVDGVVLFAPFLGYEEVIAETAATGDPRRWSRPRREPHKQALLAPEELRRLWGWLAKLDEGEVRGRMYLCYGRDDSFATANGLLAELVPPSQVVTISGGHDWETWQRLLDRLLSADSAPPAFRGAQEAK